MLLDLTVKHALVSRPYLSDSCSLLIHHLLGNRSSPLVFHALHLKILVALLLDRRSIVGQMFIVDSRLFFKSLSLAHHETLLVLKERINFVVHFHCLIRRCKSSHARVVKHTGLTFAHCSHHRASSSIILLSGHGL
jgi:hypothetical protein